MKLISACLCGINCKYNGGNNLNPYYLQLLRQGNLIPICPEQLAGLTTPRMACELMGGTGADVISGKAQVFTRDGRIITDIFIKGAHETLRIAIHTGADTAILQSRSPSCGCGKIYDGSFTGKLVDGDGVSTALLRSKGIKVWNDQEYLCEKGVCTNIEGS